MHTQRIQELLSKWYSDHFRALPWREDPTPYHIWISEIMLQQTRIEAVLPYYQRFIREIPDVASLASISEDRLLKLWEGLGYYSRAHNLQKAATYIVANYDGDMPKSYEELLTLPGVGAYTAGAIASIAFSIPVPAVDGNVMRVLSRLTGDDTDVLSTAGKKRFTELAQQLIPQQLPGRFNQALMELGETVCLPNGAPRCSSCPLQSECTAFREGLVQRLPVRIKKTKRRIENRVVLFVRSEEKPFMVLLHRRERKGLLAGLWELPNAISARPLDALPADLRKHCIVLGELPESKHLFSHIEWQMNGYFCQLSAGVALPDHYVLVTCEQLQEGYPLPSAFSAYTRLFQEFLCEEL